MRLLIFLLIVIVMAPFQVLAMVGYTFKLWAYNIHKGISGTAYEPFMARMVMHDAGTRPDEAAVRLAPHLPALNLAIAVIFRGLGLASRWSGYRGSMFAYPAARPSTMMAMIAHRADFFDRSLAEATDSDGEHPVQQAVILGSGWDTRAYGSVRDGLAADGPVGDAGVRFFEVDMPPTLQAKRTALARAGIPSDHVTFVETDFNQKSWFQAVTEQGFDPALPTFILWEGVTMYLTEEAVEATLRQVSQFASGSRIAFDYMSRELVQAEPPFVWLGRYAKHGMKFYKESWHFGISTLAPARQNVDRLVTAQVLDLAAYEPLGDDRAGKTPFGGLALAVVRG
jgi:methyltransferase (TIGR00027 family)